ncbi:MAG: HD domain-containing protein, partial [Clostridia bacterium]|nr:HD domain-containing protein [Clostridia bacterium]
MKITNEMLTDLRAAIVPYLTGKRLEHTLAVEECAAELGKVYLPEQVEKLRAAALLHDIT